MGNFTVSLKKLTEKVSMDVVYTPQDLENISVEIAEVNRPGLFLAGYYDYFDKLRLQIMGLAEMNFLAGLPEEKRRERLDQLFRQQPPAVIVGRSEELEPFPEMLELAKKHGVALLRSNETTCTLMGSLISVLNLELAPRITRHGVLVEVYGEGILILGDSGIGKSELAIELVKRGHRLVADDAVELRKVSNRQIMGTAPENIRHFIELRGIGIVNVARIFGDVPHGVGPDAHGPAHGGSFCHQGHHAALLGVQGLVLQCLAGDDQPALDLSKQFFLIHDTYPPS